MSGIFICQVSPLGQFLSSWLIYSNTPSFERTAFGKALIPFLFAEFMGDYCNCIDLRTIAHTQTQKAGGRKTCIKSCYGSHVPESSFYWLGPRNCLADVVKKKRKRKKKLCLFSLKNFSLNNKPLLPVVGKKTCLTADLISEYFASIFCPALNLN